MAFGFLQMALQNLLQLNIGRRLHHEGKDLMILFSA
jgi:hypothetical protein